MYIQDYADSITIRNDNSIRQTIVTAILCIPVIPGGVVALWKYKDKIKIIRNKYYNFKRHSQRVKDMHGVEIFRKKIWGIF